MSTCAWLRVLGACAALALLSGPTRAHEGERHGEAAPLNLPSTTDPSRLSLRGERLADGAVFLPKPAQYRLGIRTVLAASGSHARTVVLSGLVIPDPNYRAVVAAAEAGLLEAPVAGFPALGSRVEKGAILAYLRPVVSSAEEVRRRAALAKIKQDLSINKLDSDLLQSQTRGQVTMASLGTVIQGLQTEAQAMRARAQEIEASLERRVALIAPVAGTISLANARIGALVDAGNTVFEVLDPGRLWIRAITYDPALGGSVAVAHALTERGAEVALRYVGQGLQMRDQALPMDFSVTGGSAPLRVGQSLTVHVSTGEQSAGIALPAASLARTADRGDIVWVQTHAERFVAKPVTAVPLGRDRVLVTAGVSVGERIVTGGAWLLSQVR